MQRRFFFTTIFSLALLPFSYSQKMIELTKGLVIKESCSIKANVYKINSDSLKAPVLTIQGDNITIDFSGATLWGSGDKNFPNEFEGLGILIKNSKNVTIKNLNARGFKVALMAEGVDSLKIFDADFSYNYRQKLYSTRERENFADWMSYHQNEKDEWLRYGAAIYLKNCHQAVVRDVRISSGQNGILLTNCNNGTFYNNNISYNSGIGIGLYRAKNNRIMHNRLDFNVRGYSHGFYSRGQDSAAILLYEQSNDNTIAYNSATHSGDGLFLWAGQSTMDTGEGGCNNNLIYGNDFSYAPTNGIEVTFSSNKIINNQLNGCTYGIWGGYSYKTLIAGNTISNNKFGVAIEHGQDNAIEYNYFSNNGFGIQLWERTSQPQDWGYAQKRDVQSRGYDIRTNIFMNDSIPLKIAGTTRVAINDNNKFAGFKKLLVADSPNEQFFLVKNDIHESESWGDADTLKKFNRQLAPLDKSSFLLPLKNESLKNLAPKPLADGKKVPRPNSSSRENIHLTNWGPYNFEYPVIILKEIKDNLYHFSLKGPYGEWQLRSVIGLRNLSKRKGLIGDTFTAERRDSVELINLQLEYTGSELFTALGDTLTAGTPLVFDFVRYEKPLNWKVQWYQYDENSDPLKNYDAFARLKFEKPLKEEQAQQLAYVWWGTPGEGIPADGFATFAESKFDIRNGKYKIILTSDDGVRLWLDGKLVIDHWDMHEPAVDEVEVNLGGAHKIEIEHFDISGFSNLDFRIEPAER